MRRDIERRFQAHPMGEPDPQGPAYYVVGGVLATLIGWAVIVLVLTGLQ